MTTAGASHTQTPILVVNGWAIFAHPCFLDQLESLLEEVEALKRKLPEDYLTKNATRRLAAIAKLAWELIPDDPEKAEYRQGDTLGDARKHWFRAKFFQQYRLFFRFHKPSRTIILGWVNDDRTRRAYGSASDAYRVFGKMLDRKRPPDDWDTLLAEARAATPGLAKATGSSSAAAKSAK
ncbi:type II toxin-antitoxin system YhaV family toxin [Paraburkholderia tropica]|uniref:type II toxin-antitoxin system YhaV family toxin n=1 Tax=Paraburkholderia tropica TaxID=92647 RepID=UPI002AB73A44|nr:type II toxin-antitoxin system YhaV family toxin [Paraburkholderia tropica]